MCVGPYERHEAWTQKGGDERCVCMLQVDIAGEVYRPKELWRLWENDLKKKMNVRDGQNAKGGGGRGGRVHAREKVSASYKRQRIVWV